MANKQSNQTLSIILIGVLFFIFGFVTWLNGTLIPYLKIACELTDFQSLLVAFAFYIAYFVMAIPSSMILERTGFKKGMMLGLSVIAAGALIFVPAASSRMYSLFLLGLFIIGTGLAILQTAANPYITILGPIESAAKRISVMGICNKIAGILSAFIMAPIVLDKADVLVETLSKLDPAAKAVQLDILASKVIVPYIIIAVVLFGLAIMIRYSALPEINTNEEDEHVTAANAGKTSVFQFPHLVLGALAIFFSVAAEVIAGDTISNYGKFQGIDLDTAKFFTSLTLTAMVIGYIIGIIAIPKYLNQRTALKLTAIIGAIFSMAAVSTTGFTSVLFIALLGFANSLMWPAIWPLAIDGLGRFTKTGSSLLVMGIAGGAIIPPLYGKLADPELLGPQQAYWILIPCYAYILYYALSGYRNKNAKVYTTSVNTPGVLEQRDLV